MIWLQGKLVLGFVAILLVGGGVLLARFMTQSESPKVQERAALPPVGGERGKEENREGSEKE